MIYSLWNSHFTLRITLKRTNHSYPNSAKNRDSFRKIFIFFINKSLVGGVQRLPHLSRIHVPWHPSSPACPAGLFLAGLWAPPRLIYFFSKNPHPWGFSSGRNRTRIESPNACPASAGGTCDLFYNKTNGGCPLSLYHFWRDSLSLNYIQVGLDISIISMLW